MSQREHILQVALERFAFQGIAATSIQDVADQAEVSKANVLYHFSKKDELINHALAPALNGLERVIGQMEHPGIADRASREQFVDHLVDFLLTHRMATHVIVSHPYLSTQVASLGLAHQLMGQMAELVSENTAGSDDRLRFGVAISGATYSLVSSGMLGINALDQEALRVGLRDVLAWMMAEPAKVNP